MSAEDSKRPFGFMLIRYYQSENQVPEMALNPEDIAECYSVPERFNPRDAVMIKLKDGTKLKLWLYSQDLKSIIADIDVAMRERLSLRESPRSQP